MVASQS